jgi:predicted nucleotide-binding protein
MAGNKYGDASVGGDGNINFGGKNVTQKVRGPARRERQVTADPEPDADELAADRTRNVFVVYGRDEQVRSEVFGLLRRLDLRPLEWEALVHSTQEGSPFLGRVVADAPSLAQAAVVALTPDDVVMLHPELRGAREERYELHPALQPRPNVVLELGMVLALYPQNTIILEFGALRPIADITGRNVIRFDDSVSLTGALGKIAGRLKTAGCPVDDSGADWLDVGPFKGMKAYRRRPVS